MRGRRLRTLLAPAAPRAEGTLLARTLLVSSGALRARTALVAAGALLVPAALATAAGFVRPPSLAAQGLPSPASVLGFEPGDDFRLATYEESLAWFERLAAASDRIRMVEVGRTSFGRPWKVAVISSAENLARVDEWRDAARRLARGDELDEAGARALAREGRAIVDVNGGLHATEVAGAQHTIRLAWELVSGYDDDSRIREILDGVVVVVWPSLNPDGQTMVADWYRSNVGTPFETAPLPELYQKYVGHDNNRDAYMLNMVESRVTARVWREWEPQIIYVHHQSSPFPTRIWLPPFAEPVAPRAPPLMSREVNAIGMLIAQALETRGMPGATHMGTGFDAWYPGYIDYLPMLRGQVAFWTETALHAYATPRFYTLADFPRSRRELRVESLYSSPWEGGWWRLRDAVDYMTEASLATLSYAARYRETLLFNRWQAGRQVAERYAAEPPFAYLVPPDQRDPVAAVELLRRLAYAGLRVERTTRPVRHDGVAYPEGTWVVPMAQPWAEVARQLLEVQTYPDLREYPEGPPEQPYDAAGWTLPYQMGVRVVEARTPLDADVRAALEPLVAEPLPWNADVADASPFDVAAGVGFDDDPVAAGIRPPPGRVTGSGPALLLDPAQNNTFRALNRAWRAGARVRLRNDAPGGARYVVTGMGGGAVEGMVSELALRAERGGEGGVAVPRPRIGVYRPWTASMDEGWTRWLLESFGFDFANLRPGEVRGGELRARYDVIVLPSERPGRLLEGWAEGSVPPRYAGGLEGEGVRALDAFVRDGGTLVALNAAAPFAIDALHLPVRDVLAGLGREDFFSGGSILEARVDTRHPLMAGMPERAPLFFDRSPVFDAGEGFEGAAAAVWPERGSPLLSGYLLGAERMAGHAAVLDVRHGDGRVVLLGLRPQWRGQPFGTFRILFNALLYTEEVAGAARGTEGFWGGSDEVSGGTR